MKRNSLLKFCSLALALVMTLATFGGTFVVTFAEETETITYDVWDGSSVDTEWEVAASDGEGNATAYYISSAAELAGLAKATNDAQTKVPAAYQDITFYLTANMDISAAEWTAIGSSNNYRFGGSIIGMNGKVADAVVYIKGLNGDATSANFGLVGTFGYTGDIKNITLVDPTITTANNSQGFFVGYSANNASGDYHEYTNLTVINGTITRTASGKTGAGGIVGYGVNVDVYTNCNVEVTIDDGANANTRAGGILGYFNNTNGATFNNCNVDFTYKNTAAAQRIGGITGGNANGCTMQNCHAVVDITTAGAANDQLVGGLIGFHRSQDALFENCSATGTMTITGVGNSNGYGGLVGVSRNKATFTNCVSTVDITATGCTAVGGLVGQKVDAGTTLAMTNCYYGGTMTVNTKQAGGLIGVINNGTTVTMTNCQFDGVVDGTATQIGAFVGRWNLGESTLTMTNCVNTGVSKNTYSNGMRGFGWVGTAANHAALMNTFNFDNCYGNMVAPILGSNDADEATGFSDIDINTVTVSGDFVGAYVESTMPTLLNGEVTLNENWTVANGVTPVLNVAADVERPFAAADLSWFDGSFNFVLTDDADCIGLAQLSWLSGYSKTAYTYIIDPEAMSINTRWLFNGAQAWVGSIANYIINGMAPGSFATGDVADNLNVYWQVAEGDNQASATTTVRLVSTVDADDIANYAEVGFIIYKGTAAVGYVSSTKIYTAISTGDVTVTAAEIGGDTADYYFTAVLSDVPSADFGTNLTVRAYVITNDGEIIVGEAHTGNLNSLLPAVEVEEETEAA